MAAATGKITVNAHAVTTTSNIDSWFQPSNTLGAVVLADATLTTSWVSVTEDGVFEKVGTLEFFDFKHNFIVIKSGTTYYKVSYKGADALAPIDLKTVYEVDLTEAEFEAAIDDNLGVSIYVFYGANGTIINFRY